MDVASDWSLLALLTPYDHHALWSDRTKTGWRRSSMITFEIHPTLWGVMHTDSMRTVLMYTELKTKIMSWRGANNVQLVDNLLLICGHQLCWSQWVSVGPHSLLRWIISSLSTSNSPSSSHITSSSQSSKPPRGSNSDYKANNKSLFSPYQFTAMVSTPLLIFLTFQSGVRLLLDKAIWWHALWLSDIPFDTYKAILIFVFSVISWSTAWK